MFEWQCSISGPEDTPYEGGTFKLTLSLPDGYPFNPPKVKFVTKVYHPNIDHDGRICLDFLEDKWSPAYNINSILLSISSILNDPNPYDAYNFEAGQLYLHDRAFYDTMVRVWVNDYARGSQINDDDS